ncbi:MAG: hypothetical protein Q9195_005557 [Heterodermia aff. obscurata]
MTINTPPPSPPTSTTPRSVTEVDTEKASSVRSRQHGSELERIETAEELGGNALGSSRAGQLATSKENRHNDALWFDNNGLDVGE